MSAVVEARGLVKTYGEITAVDHVDLTVEAGDVYGYLGPNGAGKTTSLRMLLGLIRPTSGQSRLFGRDPMVDGVRALAGVAGLPTWYVPSGIRTRVLALKGPRPGPLDDGDIGGVLRTHDHSTVTATPRSGADARPAATRSRRSGARR